MNLALAYQDDDLEERTLEDERKILARIIGESPRYTMALPSHPQLKQTEVMRFLSGHFKEKGLTNGLLLGNAGCGKTFGALVYAVANAKSWVNVKGDWVVQCKFNRAYQLNEAIQRKDWDLLKAATNTPMLIIDDLGIESGGYKSADFNAWFENLFIERHHYGRTTLITSNYTAAQFVEFYGPRIISRLRETGDVFESKDPDLRRASA